MAVKINESQLQMTVNEDAAKPDVYINPVGHAIFHLTQGFNPSDFPQGQRDALTAGAHVPLGGNPGTTAFGFVQIGRLNHFGAYYAGRIAREGSITILVHEPPAMPINVLLDGVGNPPMPFFADLTPNWLPPNIHCSWGDHPASRVPLRQENFLTSRVPNYLYHYLDDRDFWTIFTAQEPGKAPHYIAHFQWKLRYDVKFRWRNGNAIVQQSASSLSIISRKVKGPPKEPDLQSLLITPRGPRSNLLMGDALRRAFSQGSANRQENSNCAPNIIPGDFWG
ncbi:MAG TPA: hypothetical protein VF550_01470 [Polyangia bacterium]|jgi:hypothetical protein